MTKFIKFTTGSGTHFLNVDAIVEVVVTTNGTAINIFTTAIDKEGKSIAHYVSGDQVQDIVGLIETNALTR